MILTELELQSIRDYLLEQKLPIDILLEIQDHIVSQISELQLEKNLSFESAFSLAKESWRKELRPYWDGSWDLEDRSDLIRNFEKTVLYTNGFKALKWGLLMVVIVGLMAKILSFDFFKFFVLGISLLTVSITLFLIIKHWKTFRLQKSYSNKYILSLYQNYALLPLAGGYFLFKFIIEYQAIANGYYLIMNNGALNFGTMVMLLVSLAFFSSCLFSIICQLNYLKRMKLVIPFLKNLELSQ
jgi:hypothetical protein